VSVPDSTPSPDPDGGVDSQIVRVELGIACATFVTATLLTTAVTLPSVDWWLVPAVALGWGLLTAASDRSQLGRYLLYLGAAVAMLGIVWAVATADATTGTVPLVLYGLGIGLAANRLLFGVVRPVPAARRRRERAD